MLMGNLAALWEVSKGARDRYLSDRRLFRCSSSEGREPKFSILETLHNKSVVRPVIMEMAEKRVAGSACCLPLIPQVQVERLSGYLQNVLFHARPFCLRNIIFFQIAI